MPSSGYYNLRKALYSTLRTQDCEKLFHVITHTFHALACLATIARASYLRAIMLKARKIVFLTVIKFIVTADHWYSVSYFARVIN